MKICMVVPDPMVKGGIASVVNGYEISLFPFRRQPQGKSPHLSEYYDCFLSQRFMARCQLDVSSLGSFARSSQCVGKGLPFLL